VTEIFPVHSVGIVTSRDRFVIDFDRETLKRRIRMFRDPKLPEEFVRETFKLKDNRDWKLSQKRKLIQEDETWEEKIVQCLYRPFDARWIFYHYHAIDFGREEVMQHMLIGENLALITARSNKSPNPDHFFCSRFIVETKCGESTTQSYTFPLYLYPDVSKEDLFNARPQDGERTPNLNPKVVETLSAAYGEEPTPEEIFFYIYAVLYAPAYREKYAQFLKLDFPSVPFTADRELFQELAALGRRLVELHLLRSGELDPPLARFEGEGDDRVARNKSQGFRYEPQEERVYINQTQYFAPVPQELWEYRIGGYQVLEKWLKDRKERPLTVEEIKTYCHIVTAIARTIEIQEEIDALYPRVEEQVVDLKN
jgi:predicted helicase